MRARVHARGHARSIEGTRGRGDAHLLGVDGRADGVLHGNRELLAEDAVARRDRHVEERHEALDDARLVVHVGGQHAEVGDESRGAVGVGGLGAQLVAPRPRPPHARLGEASDRHARVLDRRVHHHLLDDGWGWGRGFESGLGSGWGSGLGVSVSEGRPAGRRCPRRCRRPSPPHSSPWQSRWCSRSAAPRMRGGESR